MLLRSCSLGLTLLRAVGTLGHTPVHKYAGLTCTLPDVVAQVYQKPVGKGHNKQRVEHSANSSAVN